MYQTLKNLGVDDFVIRFNNRKILNGLPAVCGFSQEKSAEVFRILDKLDKVGLDQVISDLQRQPNNELDESAIALSDQGVEKIKGFLALSEFSNNPEGQIAKLSEFFAGVKIAEEGIRECRQIISNLQYLGIPQANWKFDLSVARGLGYYTGPVFETSLTDLPEIGSVFSGGRFDELVMRFTGEKVPAVGVSVGVDRLIAALEKLGKIKKSKATAKVLFAMIDPVLDREIFKLANELRDRGVNAEVYLGKTRILKDQLIYAAKREIPYFVILGQDEKAQGKIKLKDMRETGMPFNSGRNV